MYFLDSIDPSIPSNPTVYNPGFNYVPAIIIGAVVVVVAIVLIVAVNVKNKNKKK